MPESRIHIPKEKLAAWCEKWRVVEFSLFGSVLTDNFRPDSDVDIMVSFETGLRRTLFDLAAMKRELAEIFHRPVDLVTRRGVEESRNPFRRKAILSSAETVHVAG